MYAECCNGLLENMKERTKEERKGGMLKHKTAQ
jgi:hypothetical protein